MRIFFYEDYNDLNVFFGGRHSSLVPFLDTTVTSFTMMRLLSDGSSHLYAPWESPASEVFKQYENVNEVLSGKPEDIVLLVSSMSSMVADLSMEDLAFMKQRPDKLFSNNGVVGGYITTGKLPEEAPEDNDTMFDCFVTVGLTNFLTLNQVLTAQLRGKSVAYSGRSFGAPLIKTNKIVNSTICGPCFIDENSSITNSYISPGSVVLNSVVTDSKLLSSFVHDSLCNSSSVEDLVASSAEIRGVELKNSRIPFGGSVQREGTF